MAGENDPKPIEGNDPKPADPNAAGPKPGEQDPTDPKPAGDGVKDSHGQPGINKERHDKEVAALNKRIEELQSQIDDAAKTEKAREELKKEVQSARDAIKEEKINWQLEKAGCKNLKAAKALLDDYEGDVAKLKADCPYLFEEEAPKGSTGGKPGGALDDKAKREAKAAEAAGLPKGTKLS